MEEWRGRRRNILPRQWKTGASILYLGRELSLAVRSARKEEISADLLNLTVLHPAAADEQNSVSRNFALCLRIVDDAARRAAMRHVPAVGTAQWESRSIFHGKRARISTSTPRTAARAYPPALADVMPLFAGTVLRSSL